MIYSFKNRIYASFFLSERIYAILATQIYSLTFCKFKKTKDVCTKKRGGIVKKEETSYFCSGEFTHYIIGIKR